MLTCDHAQMSHPVHVMGSIIIAILTGITVSVVSMIVDVVTITIVKLHMTTHHIKLQKATQTIGLANNS